MHIYNTQSRSKAQFIPLQEGVVRIYVCGPTVYDEAHLGHARSALAFDLLRRTLTMLGYRVIFVKNFTDIDDKILQKLQNSSQTLSELTTHYIDRYKEDMHALGIADADIEPKVSEDMESIITFIDQLIKKGYAYTISEGIYFDVSKDPDYFSLSHRAVDLESQQARVEGSSEKRDPRDFALWKLDEDAEVAFDSPWGRGRPGWHIECSAMIDKHLALSDHPYQIDIHGGGADLLFPHHENEAAQSRCHSGINLAKYWMHNGFVQIDGEKMSKSLGNSFFLKDALKVYDGEILRFYLLSTHYRANFNFNEVDLQMSKKRLDKLYRLKKRLATLKTSAPQKAFKEDLLEAMRDDLNISKALSLIDKMIQDANEALDQNPKDKAFKYSINSNIALINQLLGIGGMDPVAYFQLGVSNEQIAQIQAQIAKRDEAKKAKDYQEADRIRDDLLKQGIKLMDTPQGTQWERDETLL